MHSEFVGPDGRRWPSVTQLCDTINRPFLYRWYGKHGNKRATRILKASASVGTAFHDAIEKHLTVGTKSDTLSSRIGKMISTFELDFMQVYDPKVEVLEGKVIHNALRYHGTYDGIIDVKDGKKRKRVLCDWKSSNSVHDSYGIQLALYNMALPKDQQVEDGWIIRVGKKRAYPELEVRKFEHLRVYEPLALACRELWDFINHEGCWEVA